MYRKNLYFSKQPQVSIIVLFHNGADVTLDCLRAIKKFTQKVSYEVILVNNGSDFDQTKLLKAGISKLGKLPLIELHYKINLGYSIANNRAVNKANSDYLVFLNNDVVVTKNWLTPLLGFMGQNTNVAVCQPKVLSYVEKDYFDYTGGAGGYLDVFGYPFTRGRIFDSIEKDFGQYDSVREVAWATGACLVIRKNVFLEVGGFDSYFFAYFEELDLCVNLRELGYKIFCVPESVVYHWGAYTSNANLKRKVFLNHRNHLYFIFKHYSLWPYFPIILIRILMDFGSIIYYIGSLRFSFVLSVVNAYKYFLMDVPSLIKKKTISMHGRSLLFDNTVMKKSIVIAYFLFGVRNFDQLNGTSVKGKRFYKKYKDVTFFNKVSNHLSG